MSFCVLLLYSSFVHHKSLRYELNHLIAIIRLSQLVIGIDERTRILIWQTLIIPIVCVCVCFQCMATSVSLYLSLYRCCFVNFWFLCISVYLFKNFFCRLMQNTHLFHLCNRDWALCTNGIDEIGSKMGQKEVDTLGAECENCAIRNTLISWWNRTDWIGLVLGT